MQPQVIAALISGAIAIISPLTTYYFTRVYDRRIWGKIKGRRRAIVGTWKGNIAQTIQNDTYQIPIEISFTAGKKIIEGHATLIFPNDNELMKLRFTGGFYHERFIKFEYKNENEEKIQFGSAVMDLLPDGQSLMGKYVGYGSKTNQIVLGEVLLRRSL